MLRVGSLVMATSVVQEREELDHLRVGVGAASEAESVHAAPAPVLGQ